MLVSEAFPELSEELRELLRNKREAELAEQISELKLVDRCRCGDDFCAGEIRMKLLEMLP